MTSCTYLAQSLCLEPRDEARADDSGLTDNLGFGSGYGYVHGFQRQGQRRQRLHRSPQRGDLDLGSRQGRTRHRSLWSQAEPHCLRRE